MDLEIPLDISAHELLLALNEAFGLGLDPADSRHWYLKSERPFALLKGGRALTDFGIRQGSLIKYSL